MAIRQHSLRVRRTYNQWVANQMLEDYALRFTAKSARRWSSARVANTAIGAISFLALEAIGATITLNYGAANAVTAILVVSVLIFLSALPITYYAARHGVDIDLLTRGAGFGYIGSTITSLIYAGFTFIFFALEAVIMATALELCFGIPLSLGYVLGALAVIPIVIYGITVISWLQLWTQPLWIVLQLLPFTFIGWQGIAPADDWIAFSGQLGDPDGSVDLLLFGAASAVVFSLIAQIGEQVDYLRFMPKQQHAQRWRWWLSMLCAGPGWIVLGALKMLAGSLLVVITLAGVMPAEMASDPTDPTQLYLTAFSLFASPEVAIALTGIFVITCQIKINVTNSYAGSIAWSNFFSRLTHSHPGRVVWLVFNVVIALFLMELGIFKALESTLGLYSIIAVAWIGAIVADLVINKPLGLSPPHIEFRRAYLYDINPVGLGAMIGSSVVAFTAYSGVLGETAHALSSFIALFLALGLAPLIAWGTGSRYYLARPIEPVSDKPLARCCVCTNQYEIEDMAQCPIYEGPICSLCCSLDVSCEDGCKTDARAAQQLLAVLKLLLPPQLVNQLNSKVGHYLALMLLISGVLIAVFSFVYYQSIWPGSEGTDATAQALVQAFLILLAIFGILAWLFVLAHESQYIAKEETKQQTQLLLREIRAHSRTDKALQKAKEVAEMASLAKSRYIVGISHELRSPLNPIMGYAQLISADPEVPRHRRDAAHVISRSAEHLAELIEGLLDISKIESGHLTIHRDTINFSEFLEQLVDMFRLQANAKGLAFLFKPEGMLPEYVHGDEKRLRQVLINLLSNAIKYTDQGLVTLSVSYRTMIAEFSVSDSGVGIDPGDIERIFVPFERIAVPKSDSRPGTGLGLTITKLLTEVMGGEIAVNSTPGIGSCFTIRFLLSQTDMPQRAGKTPPIRGFTDQRRRIIVVDDDPSHRHLMRDLLAPMGFDVYPVPGGSECLLLYETVKPDAFLLDISMPVMSGWELAKRLRELGSNAAIIMISANVDEHRHKKPNQVEPVYHDAYLVKPLRLQELLVQLQSLLKLQSVTDTADVKQPERSATPFPKDSLPNPSELSVLHQLSQVGYVRGIQTKLDDLKQGSPHTEPFVTHLRQLVDNYDLKRCELLLENLLHADGELC